MIFSNTPVVLNKIDSLERLDAKLIYPEPELTVTGVFNVFRYAEIFKDRSVEIQLSLGELEFLPGFFLPVFLAFHHSGIAGKQTFRF